jgi:hypothetical protein
VTRRPVTNEPNAGHLDGNLRLLMETCGLAVRLCVCVKKKDADDLAEEFARMGVRAARLLGLYEEG